MTRVQPKKESILLQRLRSLLGVGVFSSSLQCVKGSGSPSPGPSVHVASAVASVPGQGTFICHGWGQKKKKVMSIKLIGFKPPRYDHNLII